MIVHLVKYLENKARRLLEETFDGGSMMCSNWLV